MSSRRVRRLPVLLGMLSVVAGATACGSAGSRATVQQYASVVAEHSDNFRQADAEEESRCILHRPRGVCGLVLTNVGTSAGQLARALSEARADLGAPPASIASLFSATLQDADALSAAYRSYQASPTYEHSAPMVLPEAHLRRDLEGWRPYGA